MIPIRPTASPSAMRAAERAPPPPMQSAVPTPFQPFQPIREAPERRPRTTVDDAVTECITRTAEALLMTGVATEAHISMAMKAAGEAVRPEDPFELIEW